MKVNQIKQKVAAKVAKGKAKVAAKCGKSKAKVTTAAVLLSCAFCFLGCQSPAQRAQTAETRLMFNINEGASGTTFNFGNEFVSLAQSNETGGNDAGQTATQTTDTKPEIAVGVGGSSAGVGGTSGTAKKGLGATIGGAYDAITDALPSGGGESAPQPSQSPQPSQAPQQSCPDGACGEGGEGACPDGACVECPNGNCSP